MSEEKISRNNKLRGTDKRWRPPSSRMAQHPHNSKPNRRRRRTKNNFQEDVALQRHGKIDELRETKRNRLKIATCVRWLVVASRGPNYRSENARNLKLIMIPLGNNNQGKGSSRIIWLIIEKGTFDGLTGREATEQDELLFLRKIKKKRCCS